MINLRRITIDHLYLVVALGSAVVCVFGLYLALYIPPPLKYTADVYPPTEAVVRPLGFLVYTPALQVQRSGPVRIVRSFWNIDTDAAALLCNGGSAPTTERTTNLPRSIKNKDRANPVRVPVPNLPPGHYWLLSSAIGTTGAVASYSVGFTIEEPC